MADNDIKWEYIGDGVYVGFDGNGYWLHANSHDQPTDRIYLERAMLRALIALDATQRKQLADANDLDP